MAIPEFSCDLDGIADLPYGQLEIPIHPTMPFPDCHPHIPRHQSGDRLLRGGVGNGLAQHQHQHCTAPHCSKVASHRSYFPSLPTICRLPHEFRAMLRSSGIFVAHSWLSDVHTLATLKIHAHQFRRSSRERKATKNIPVATKSSRAGICRPPGQVGASVALFSL